MRQYNAISHTNNISIFGGPAQNLIPDKPSNEITGNIHLLCSVCNLLKNKQLLFRALNIHSCKNKKVSAEANKEQESRDKGQEQRNKEQEQKKQKQAQVRWSGTAATAHQ
jgi:hypothetical protein